jgi:Methyltransferase domain
MKVIHQCPACAAPNPTSIVQLDSVRREAFLRFDEIKYGGVMSNWLEEIPVEVLGCRECGHAWYMYQPEPDQLSLMYSAGRPLLGSATSTNAPSAAMQQEMRKVRRLFPAVDREPLLLDYGSGRGRWARAAVAEGFRVVAYEPSVERGHETSPPFQLVHSESDLQGMKFDVIHLEQVLEHVPDPLETLTTLKALCGPHTVVRIAVPNILRDPSGTRIWETWPFDGKSPHVLAPFEHLQGFTPSSLRQLCRRAGYRPISPFRIVQTHPTNLLRQWIGHLWPRLGTTAQYLSLHP